MMPFVGIDLTIGPPGSGRTTAMVSAARAACSEGKRVWWVGLPAQRAYVLHRITEGGFTALGLEFMSAQQMFYRLLTRANRLQPMLVGSAALVRVAEAMKTATGTFPAPGEARLFARAIAEAKRFGVTAQQYEGLAADSEQRRLAAVYSAYEDIKEAWDYDDVRLAAASLAASGQLECEAALVIVDGLRETGPLELQLLQALSQTTDVRVNLSQPPPGVVPTQTLTAVHPVRLERFVAPNPVNEARWVMRSIKRDLAEGGFKPLDLAIIAPVGRVRAVVALADEYGVPLMDESPLALVDQPLGQRLVDLLELTEHPTAARLLSVNELRPLAAAALESGVAGVEAVGLLASALGLAEVWRGWLAKLELTGNPVDWARWLVQEVLGEDDSLPREFEESALAKAQEAARLGADGPGFRGWWAALLQDTRTARRENGGVALVTVNGASGRRWRKVYLIGATEGTYVASEAEDYFVPEEQRQPLPEAYQHGALPRRFQGRSELVAAELLTRGDHMVITAPQASQDGQAVPDETLTGRDPMPLPDLPAGSLLELEPEAPYSAPLGKAPLGSPTVERLRRYSECSFRVWGEGLLSAAELSENLPAWRRLVDALLGPRNSRLSAERLAQLQSSFPEAARWLGQYSAQLTKLTFNVHMFGGQGRAVAALHAALKEGLEPGSVPGHGAAGGERVVLYRFVAPGAVATEAEARSYLKGRWTEYYAAFGLLNQSSHNVQRVDVVVWPVLGPPVSAHGKGVDRSFALGKERRTWVNDNLPDYLEGRIEPSPGFHCRNCPVFDMCREGVNY